MARVATGVLRWILVVSVAAACSACATRDVQPSRESSPAPHSGFLSDYGLLRAVPDQPGWLRYVAADADITRYRAFIIEAPEVIVDTAGEFQSVDPVRLQAMSDYYRASMIRSLDHHYRVVTTPGPGVARLRVAVVGAVQVRPGLKARDALPATALFKVGRAVAGKAPRLLRMSIESELVDSRSGKVLAATVDSREGSERVTEGEGTAQEQLHQLIDFWVGRFVARLDRAHGIG
ncbi:MAG: DUF3313 domain-containing protein [Xanthomonadales bacterium]|nr:DUF3313 domain-containing protein [Xanthomonadales bacterium]